MMFNDSCLSMPAQNDNTSYAKKSKKSLIDDLCLTVFFKLFLNQTLN